MFSVINYTKHIKNPFIFPHTVSNGIISMGTIVETLVTKVLPTRLVYLELVNLIYEYTQKVLLQ